MKKTFTFNQKNSRNHIVARKMKLDIESGPSDRVLKNIFNYSRALSVLKTRNIDACHFVLN